MSTREFEPRILAFLCEWCAYAGADLAGVARLQYPPNVRPIRVKCSGRIDPKLILEALRSGADGILVAGCHPGDCHYVAGNLMTEARMKFLRWCLERLELQPERIRLEWISASEGEKLANVIREMVESIKKIGPNPLRIDSRGG